MAVDNPKRCVVVMWDEQQQQLVSYTLDVEKVRAINARGFPLELPIADFGGVIDDEFARRFGSATLNLLALTHRDMKPLLKTTQDPE